MDSLRSSPHSPFRSRRSHPALNHLSLAPLTPRFPIDDAPELDDYFSGSHAPATSYLSRSSSVPTTPPILSHSRSGSRASSRTRHHKRSKSQTNVLLSDTDLHRLGVEQQALRKSTSGRKTGSRTPDPRNNNNSRPDSEWLFRAGLALASSTREEKGQSWLVKRESSTSLVIADPEAATELRSPHRHGRSTHRSRSGYSTGYSTPAAHSRQASRSRGGGRRTELSMTAIDSRYSRKSSIDSPYPLVPDFVDERIRAEMAASMHSNETGDDDVSISSSVSDSESEDEIDEKEFQRLTRERGFGLGTWVDQFVGWTLFGVEEDDPSSLPGPNAEPSVTFAPSSSPNNNQDEDEDEVDPTADEDEFVSAMEKPGETGGWADASWFLRLATKAIV